MHRGNVKANLDLAASTPSVVGTGERPVYARGAKDQERPYEVERTQQPRIQLLRGRMVATTYQQVPKCYEVARQEHDKNRCDTEVMLDWSDYEYQQVGSP